MERKRVNPRIVIKLIKNHFGKDYNLHMQMLPGNIDSKLGGITYIIFKYRHAFAMTGLFPPVSVLYSNTSEKTTTHSFSKSTDRKYAF